jgi:hypothetical protein
MQLDGVDLPNSFRYPPFLPQKRTAIAKTAGGAIFQRAGSNGIVQGDGIINWTAELLCFDELCLMYQHYKKTGPLQFDGKYGDSYMVEMLSIEDEAVGGGNYNLVGVFIVRCVLTDICAESPYY